MRKYIKTQNTFGDFGRLARNNVLDAQVADRVRFLMDQLFGECDARLLEDALAGETTASSWRSTLSRENHAGRKRQLREYRQRLAALKTQELLTRSRA
jgi:hypothetical protein